jgi:lipoxygenase homology domain-containing protein 1
VPYTIQIYTGDIKNAGTHSKVFIELFGERQEKNSSGRIQLAEGVFKRGQIDKLNIDVPKLLTPVSRVLIGHDNSGGGWFLSKVDVICPTTGMKQVFPCEKWLALDLDDGKIERMLKENTALRETHKSHSVWNVNVFTSDLKNAGTDAKVFLMLYGDKGKTDEIELRSKDNDFETGKCDNFKIETSDIGQPFKLRVWHDNKGRASGWHLDRIEMENIHTKAKYYFVCNRWLAKDEDDHQIVRELPAEGDGIKKPLNLVKYIVEVYTGSKSGAGTDAEVFCNIFGEFGDTGDRVLDKSETNRNPFEKGKVDIFKVEAVTLKGLKKVRIGHNGRKAGAGWFLDKVIIKQEGNSKYDQTFNCNRWLAVDEDDGLIVRDLFVDGTQFLDTVSYNIKVKTGDIRNAGTDARVMLKIFGEKGDSGNRHLKNSDNTSNKFERGRLDEFRVEADDLGKIEKIKIGHNGKGLGSGWFLDFVEIDVPSQGLRYKYVFYELNGIYHFIALI